MLTSELPADCVWAHRGHLVGTREGSLGCFTSPSLYLLPWDVDGRALDAHPGYALAAVQDMAVCPVPSARPVWQDLAWLHQLRVQVGLTRSKLCLGASSCPRQASGAGAWMDSASSAPSFPAGEEPKVGAGTPVLLPLPVALPELPCLVPWGAAILSLTGSVDAACSSLALWQTGSPEGCLEEMLR